MAEMMDQQAPPVPGPPKDEQPPMPELPPNNTIYLNNLTEKVKIPALIIELRAIFNQFGNILEIQAKKNLRMRGQAFIVFDNVESAKKAVSSMQGFPFHSKKMRIQYAKGDSDIISKRAGTFVAREQSKKKKKKTKKDKAKGMAANPMAAMMNMMNPQMMMQMQKMMQSQGMQMPAGMNFQQMQKNMQEMMAKMQGGAKPGVPAAAPVAPAAMAAVPKVPNMGLAEGKFGVNNILFVQDLPEEANAEMLSMLFNQFDGYLEVRMAPARPGAGKAAFIEFDDEATAMHAKDTLQGFKVTPSCQLKITFAKK